MRVACIGGGPGGLFFAAQLRQALPDAEVVVFERNDAADAFGFGVVFSNATLGGLHEADPVLRDALRDHGRHWDTIEVRVHDAIRRCGGNGMAAIVRSKLLRLLQERAQALGASLRFQTEVDNIDELADYDLVVAADGANSHVRDQFPEVFRPSVETASAKFIWLGTTYPYTGLTFVHAKGPHGAFAAHAYPIDDEISTFIVETDETSWRAAGLDAFDVDQPPGPSDETTIAYLHDLFAEELRGHRLIGNNSRWGNFRTVRTRRWSTGRLVLLGDAAHTAHFSVGSGTKMAMEDAVVLAQAIADSPDDLDAALETYERVRRPAVEHVQGASVPSLAWWERFGRYHDAMDPTQFTFHFLSRSIPREKLQRRDPDYVAEVDAWWHDRHGTPPLDTPLSANGLEIPGRLGTLRREQGRSATLDLGTAQISLSAVDGPSDSSYGSGVLLVLPDQVEASEAEQLVDEVVAEHAPTLLVLVDGTELGRTLGAERGRLEHGVPTVLVGAYDTDAAETIILAGRADAVATEEPA